MKNLENVAINATALADVLNFVKSQAGKQTKVGDLWRKSSFAGQLHEKIWGSVREDALEQADRIMGGAGKTITECSGGIERTKLFQGRRAAGTTRAPRSGFRRAPGRAILL